MRYFLFSFILLSFLSSCGRIPEPIGYNYSTQEKMQAAHHWNVLAEDISNKINNELIRSDFFETAVFVKETCGDDSEPCSRDITTDFNEGFRDLLITRLVDFGIPTSAIPDREAITINYKVQVVHHNANRLRTLRPGLLTSLTTAVSVLRHAPAEIIAIALASGVDYSNAAYARTTNVEAIVTTSMVFRNRYLFRSSDIYYINSADYHHYNKDFKTAKTIHLTTPSGI
ncbi:MAG: hypothetical protein V2I36_01875 [Desulfopila sp.]|jgi:hypothetical protein|nr:hypothetical protein [Desulfopila sp.]